MESAAVLGNLPIESFADIPEDALCVICQQPSLDNVSMCIMGHNACRTCADKWVSSDNDNSDKCGTCRGPLTRPDSTWMANRALNNLVGSFAIKCPNVKTGCTHQCKLHEMKDHIRDCQWREIECKCTGCPWKGPLCKWQEHMKEEDHGCHLVDMLIDVKEVCTTLRKQHNEWYVMISELYRRQDAEVQENKQQLTTWLNAVGAGVNDVLGLCQTIDRSTKEKPGASARTERRDRKTAKDLTAAQEEIDELVQERDTLKRKLADLQAVDVDDDEDDTPCYRPLLSRGVGEALVSALEGTRR